LIGSVSLLTLIFFGQYWMQNFACALGDRCRCVSEQRQCPEWK
jgi:hypothetical protein